MFLFSVVGEKYMIFAFGSLEWSAVEFSSLSEKLLLLSAPPPCRWLGTDSCHFCSVWNWFHFSLNKSRVVYGKPPSMNVPYPAHKMTGNDLELVAKIFQLMLGAFQDIYVFVSRKEQQLHWLSQKHKKRRTHGMGRSVLMAPKPLSSPPGLTPKTVGSPAFVTSLPNVRMIQSGEQYRLFRGGEAKSM